MHNRLLFLAPILIMAPIGGVGHSKTTVIPPEFYDWKVETYKSPLTDKENVTLSILADDVIHDRQERPHLVKLILACNDNATALWIHFGGVFVTSNSVYGTVQYRLDKQPAQSTELDASTDNEHLGLTGGRAIRFIKGLLGKTRLFVRATPYNQSSVDINFPLKNLAELAPQLRKACNW